MPQQPVAALGVAVCVGAQRIAAVLGGDPRQFRALEQAHLAGGVSRCGRPDVPGLENHDALARPGQKNGGGEAGDAGTDHHHVGFVLCPRHEARRRRGFHAIR
jgi:hypothetical protein